MHAGIVNAGGVLIARFAPVMFEETLVMLAIVAGGGVSALLGQAWMLVQTNVKRQLGCSTVAQMGFMVLQGGLGFVAAAVTHLLLHGFYKAYLFLASGSVVEPTQPGASRTVPDLLTGAVSLGAAVGGGLLFAVLTGKSILPLHSGTLLIVFVVIAVLHATRTMVRQSGLSAATRLWVVPALLLSTLGLYAGVYNGVKAFLSGLPAAPTPTPLTPLHWGLVGVFTLAYVALERGWHRTSTRLYVTLLNTSQPMSRTLLTQRDQYHAH
jgi:NAD(P)H-quinone oxidoreductase subunit 5